MGLPALLPALLPLLLLPAHGYKIKRTDCSLDRLAPGTLRCTCGGIGDPFSIILNKGPKPELGVPYYGTRFGHNLAHQIKQKMADLNISRVTRIYYENCTDHALRVKVDFEEFPLDPIFKKDLTPLTEIVFSSVHSVALYLKSALDWGNLTIRFENVLTSHDFGYEKIGSVVVYGGVEYCYRPCSLAPPTLPGTEGGRSRCTACDPQSTLSLQFSNMSRVLLKDLSLSPSGPEVSGHCYIHTDQVEEVRVEGGSYRGVTARLAGRCWGGQDRVNCSQALALGGVVLDPGGSTALAVCAALGSVLLLLALLTVLAAARVKDTAE